MEVRFSGQVVALAVARSLEAATQAANAVKVRYVEEAHAVQLAGQEQNAFAEDINAGGKKTPADAKKGDPASALANAHAKIEAGYSTPSEIHNPMEPHATTAVWSGPDHLTLYDATQGIFGVRKRIAQAFKLPPENVRVLSKFVGGGFGCKGSAWSHVILASLAAKQLGRPVKVVLTRQQMFGLVGGRPQTRQEVAIAADAKGIFTAITHKSFSTTSRFDTFVEPAALGARHMYACDNVESTHRIVRLDIGTPTYTRAPGESSGSFALECAVDELSYQLNLDPVELRLRNEPKVDPLDGKPFSSRSLKACFELAARQFGWNQRAKKPRATTRDGLLIGVGAASASYPANLAAAKALVTLQPDGTALVVSGAVDIGTGTYTVMAQVAADALGLPVSKVRFDLGDTLMPEAPRSGGSQTAASVASAVMAACAKMREQVIERAIADRSSPLFGSTGAEVKIADGRISSARGSETYAELLGRGAGAPMEARGEHAPSDERKKFELHSYGAQFAEVAVDPLLGSIRVTRMVGAFACGRVLNRRLARSQLIGGMVWGISMALHENPAYDDHLGRMMAHDLADYHVPTHADVPAIEALMVEEEDTHVNPAGVKGMGEIGITGAAAAIANAIFHATGKRVRSLPITPETVV